MTDILIGKKKVGDNNPCYIIAEAGSNHDGKLEQAKQLVDIAAEAGADAVKFQVFSADRIAAPTKHPIAQIDFAGAKNLNELYRRNEMPLEWCPILRDYAEKKGILFLCTPFDENATDELDRMGIAAFKIASFEMVHHPLLQHVAKKGKPIILSTGLATLGEIEEALSAIRTVSSVPVILLHCGINYPLAFESVNLRAMLTIQKAFGVPVGYSDHTSGIVVPCAAVALGATVIEKHFTISRKMAGPDHSFALEPGELMAMVRGIRDVESALGSSLKMPADDEKIHVVRGKRSLFSNVPIQKGTLITKEMLSVLRPGVGLAPKYLNQVIGRRAQTDIGAYDPITWDCI